MEENKNKNKKVKSYVVLHYKKLKLILRDDDFEMCY